jgi:Zn-dependent M28 family amino/carboxypeptidase
LTPRWLPDAQSANVVGEVVGQDLPGEAVILGAHLDSWDLGEGAIDDGAGCGIVLEAGRAIAALGSRPRRTVRVVLFAAEENSLAGGTAYAKAHKAELGTIVAALEADSGTNRVAHVSALGGPEVTARLAPLVPLLAPLGVTPVEGRFAGADISPLHELGVPVVELDQDPARYFDTHHTANDTLARVDGTALSQAAAAFATAAWTIANLEGDLGRAVPSGPSH